MEFTITKETLIKGLGKTQTIIEKKTTLPILSNVLIETRGDEAIEIAATNLEVGIKGTYSAQVQERGSVTVAAKKLFEIVRELPESEIKFKALDNNWVEIACGKAIFKMVGLSSDDFPIIPSFDDETFHPLPAAMLSEMVERVQHAVSLDETRHYLNGVYFSTVESGGKQLARMVATDGHRLAMIDRELPDESEFKLEEGAIIPRKGISELRKAFAEIEDDVNICFKDRNIVAKTEDTLYLIRLIDGDFPEYSQVIPAGNDKMLNCSRDQLLGSLRRISLLSTELNKGVKFSLDKKVLELSSSNPELGEAKEELLVGYESDPMDIGFNARYFLDVLNVVGDEDVVIQLADELAPGMIKTPGDPGFTAVVMPMRL